LNYTTSTLEKKIIGLSVYDYTLTTDFPCDYRHFAMLLRLSRFSILFWTRLRNHFYSRSKRIRLLNPPTQY